MNFIFILTSVQQYPSSSSADNLTINMGAVTITDLTKQYNNGRVLGLLGPNGSGKATTMKLITGLLHPDEGDVSIYLP